MSRSDETPSPTPSGSRPGSVRDEATAYKWAAQALRGLEGKAQAEAIQTAMDRVASAVLEAARGERYRWAGWIGNTVAVRHARHRPILWDIAQAMERNNYGQVAKPS